MREIDISKFKAVCLAVLDEVEKTQEPICITRNGKPIVQIGPAVAFLKAADAMGCMIGRIQILGDIVSPSTDENEWDGIDKTPEPIRNTRRGQTIAEIVTPLPSSENR